MKYCTVCGQVINPLRVRALPNTTTCVEHSNVSRVAGYQIITGKHTYSELEIGEASQIERLYALGSRSGQSPVKGARIKGH